jgi:glycosyltransferase involved in cell wall biosynthesis
MLETQRRTVPLRILYVSQYFPPEMGAPSARVSELAKMWARQGCDVTVLTGFPNHPTGVLHAGYRGKIWRLRLTEHREGVRVCRTWLYPAANQGVWTRCLNYISFMLSAILTGICLLGKADVVIATSPQLLVGLAGYVIACIKRVPFVLELRDLWPESLAAVEVTGSNSLFIRGLDRLARFLYQKADLIIPVTDSFQRILAARGVAKGKMVVVKNGIDTALFRPSVDAAILQERYGVNGDFVVSYIGTLGLAHKIDTVLEAAERLRAQRDIRFVLVGEGAEKEKLKAACAARRLDNVLFVDQQPHADIPRFIAASDACLVLLKKTELFKTVIPSKMFEYMGMGRPVILGVEGEAREILQQANGGLAIGSESASELAAAILRLYHDRRLCRTLGENGRRFVLEHYDRMKLATDYASALQGCFLSNHKEKEAARWALSK